MDLATSALSARGMSIESETRLRHTLADLRRLKIGVCVAVAVAVAAAVFAGLAYFRTSFDTLTVRHLDVVAAGSLLGEDAAINIQLNGSQSMYGNSMSGMKITMPGGGQNVASTNQAGIRVAGGQSGVVVSGTVGTAYSAVNDVSVGTPTAFSATSYGRDSVLTDGASTSHLGQPFTQATVLSMLKTAGSVDVAQLNVSGASTFADAAVFQGGLATLDKMYLSMPEPSQTQTFTPDDAYWFAMYMNAGGALCVYPVNNAGMFMNPGTSTDDAVWTANVPSAALEATPAWLAAATAPAAS